ncbi:hypothetical protein EBT31_07040 [bacterium]|nr:hypothetical protein [bacterium]
MITYTEFFLFMGMMVAIGCALHWRAEAYRFRTLFKLMVTEKVVRDKILEDFETLKQRMG